MRDIRYRGFKIIVTTKHSRFGTMYITQNNIGEPYIDSPAAFPTLSQAINFEKRNINKYLLYKRMSVGRNFCSNYRAIRFHYSVVGIN